MGSSWPTRENQHTPARAKLGWAVWPASAPKNQARMYVSSRASCLWNRYPGLVSFCCAPGFCLLAGGNLTWCRFGLRLVRLAVRFVG